MSGHHEEEALGKGYDARLARRLLKYLRPYRHLVVTSVVLTLVSSIFYVAGPYLLRITVDRYLIPGLKLQLSYDAAMRGVQWIAVVFFLALVARFGLDFLLTRIMQRVGQKAIYDLRSEIFAHLQRLPMNFYDRNPVGRLVTRVTTDVDALNELFASGVVAMLGDLFALTAIVAVLFGMDWRLALISLLVLPLIGLVTIVFRASYREANRRIRTAVARINSFLQEHISGMTVIQLFNRQRKTLKVFAEINDMHRQAFRKAIQAFALFYPAVEFLGVLAVVMILWFGGLRVIATDAAKLAGLPEPIHKMTLGVLIAFIQYAGMFFRPIQDLSEKYSILQAAMAASERIFKLLDEPLAAETKEATQELPYPKGEIEFRDVWFSYKRGGEIEDADWVLRDVSFRIAPGETAAIVGHTGAGKTTLISLLLRFYEVQRGEILLDGVDIRELSVHELRRQFGIVLQDPFLFTGTIETNVRLGTSDIDRAGVERALEEVRLGAFVRQLPGGVETQVTERGATLSVGQRQLISFARALAHNPRFLILDEATSSVDTQTEMMIREALDRLLEGRTAFVIAHRLSTIQRADRILVFHKGRLREQGTHQELLGQRGIYYRLYQLQYKDQEIRMSVPASEDEAAMPADD